MILNIKINYWFITISFLVLCLKVDAQKSPNETYEYYKEAFPEESGIITEYNRVITIKKNGDSLDIMTQQYKEVLIIDKPSRWVKENIYSSSFSKVQNIEAYTHLPGKRKYKKIPVEEFKRSYDKDSYIFFDDTEVINFNFPQLVEGSRISTSYNWKSTDPHVIGSYYFSSYVPTLHASFKIIAEDGIDIIHGIVNDSILSINYNEEVLKDGSRVYTYQTRNIPKIDYQENNPGFGYLSPSVYVLIAAYEDTNQKRVPVLSSLSDLHNWYRTFIDDMEIDSSLQDLTRKIVGQDDPQIEKVRKIFYWVQDNIKYIAFEDGMRGFIPHHADYVLEKRYGDCKDMTSILVGLLRAEGVDAKFTWIGSRQIPFKYTDVPSPIVDNHMIASVKIEDRTYFLDATGSYSPLGFPTAMIQGKESLISYGDEFEIMEVPIVEKERNQMNDSSTIWLNKGVVHGKGHVMFSGLMKVENTNNLIQRTSKGEDGFIRRLLSRGNNKFLVEDYSAQNIEDLDKPIEINYTFNVADYYREVGDEIYFNLCLDRSLTKQAIKERTTPVENDYKFVSSSYTTLTIPKGYQVKSIPQGGASKSPNLGFEINYIQGSNTITFESKIYVDFLIMYPNSFNAWNKVVNEYARLTRRTIVLEKINKP